jgi:hypothetical protein
VTLKIFADAASKTDKKSQRWFAFHALDAIPIPSPHRRAISAILH